MEGMSVIMINFKQEIAEKISYITNTKIEEEYIEKPKDVKMGDYAFPCFRNKRKNRYIEY